jgi:hypothetical protein
MTSTNFITKECSSCEDIKPLNEFYKRKSSKDGYHCHCKSCVSLNDDEYKRTKKGLVLKIYKSQISRSKARGYAKPDYSLNELREWVFSQDNFNEIYESWVLSDYKKMLIPSCDRLDDYKPYSLPNIRLVTWQENKSKSYCDRKNGLNNKHSKYVAQFNIDGELISGYYSTKQAERETGVANTSISACCLGKRKTAGGFIWKRR